MTQQPRYRELATELRDAILSERTLLDVQLTDGAQLPTEPELAAHFQASRGTIRQALRELSAEGLIETRGRGGTFVRRLHMFQFPMDAEITLQKGTSDSWTSVVEAAGREPSQDFGFRIEAAGEAVADRLGLEARDLVVVRDIERFIDGTPWSSQVSYYPYDIAKLCEVDVPENIPEGTIRRMAAHGYAQDELTHEITSRPANEDERRTFALAPGVSVLLYRRVARSGDRMIRYTVDVLPADRNVIGYSTAGRVDR